MSQEMPPKIPTSDVDLERYIDRPFDLVARVQAAKESAQREMETFGNVSEYEIRKIYGQKSELSYDSPEVDHPADRDSTSEVQNRLTRREFNDQPHPVESQSAFDFAAAEPALPDAPPEEA